MTGAGRRDKLITFERNIGGKDAHGGKIENWQFTCEEWAAVAFGRAEERRQAGQESANQTATFRVLAHPLTETLTPLSRIAGFMGSNWNITAVVPYDGEVEITAVRKAG